MQDRIEKTVELKAPVDRVWRALTNHDEFGEWFRVKLERPFEVGQVTRGQITYPGHEHMQLEATVKTIDPQRLFSFTWCPCDDSPEENAWSGAETLIEFRLEPTPEGTRLHISESGFSQLPEDVRANALRRNSGGWDEQARNIAAYVES